MAKAGATRTLNPLHFEDLEPHRFEDLVRQLSYDSRQWRSIEAIGRSGSDQGMDVRGWERISGTSELPSDEERVDEESAPTESTSEDRLWVIQCKREKALPPAKLKKILKEFFDEGTKPYGYVLAAATDFSKAARDAGAEILRDNGVSEFQFWGKGELEDMLVQPKNDHLLFAYFNISLQVRRRSARTDLRSKLALKRTLLKALGGEIQRPNYRPILLRDPRDDQYPNVRSKGDFVRKPRWRYWEPECFDVNGLWFVEKRFKAFVNWETEEWDFTNHFDQAIWTGSQLWGVDHANWDPDDRNEIVNAYVELEIPEENRASAVQAGFVSFDRMLLVDDIGDVYNSGPHLLVEFTTEGSPFEATWRFIEASGAYDNRRIFPKTEEKRIVIFPKQIPDKRKEYQELLRKRLDESSKRGRD